MRIAYFDCFSGISGDMALGALLDAGLKLEPLLEELSKLPLKDYRLEVRKVDKGGILATQVVVHSYEKGVVRYWSNIEALIKESALHLSVKKRSLEIFQRLAQVEAKIHGKTVEQIHFHEIGAVDSIVDIVGVAAGIHLLGIEKVVSSALPTGKGVIRTEHGILPLPAPATLEILQGVPVYGRDVEAELTTPTGAAIITTIADSFEEIPPMQIEKIGYGAGYHDLEIPNLLRIIIGQELLTSAGEDLTALLSTNIDDLNPEIFDYLIEKLLKAGALDVWLTPIQMKKNRPAITLKVLSPPQKIEQLSQIIFTETTTLGIRVQQVKRKKLKRKVFEVTTLYGNIKVKVAYLGEKVVNISPEYEDCAHAAKESGVPIKDIFELAREKAREELKEL